MICLARAAISKLFCGSAKGLHSSYTIRYLSSMTHQGPPLRHFRPLECQDYSSGLENPVSDPWVGSLALIIIHYGLFYFKVSTSRSEESGLINFDETKELRLNKRKSVKHLECVYVTKHQNVRKQET